MAVRYGNEMRVTKKNCNGLLATNRGIEKATSKTNLKPGD